MRCWQNGVEARPSRLVLQRVGEAVQKFAGGTMRPSTWTGPRSSRTRPSFPFPLSAISGGAATLTRQSLCPFQAFATVRLAAENFDPAEAGLNARQRGLLLHCGAASGLGR